MNGQLFENDDRQGLAIAFVIVCSWIGSLLILLPSRLSDISTLGIGLAILVRTFLQTGLFITAHDAIHSSLCPSHRSVNDAIGRWAMRLYAFLDYERCQINHWKHHRHPTDGDDPDFYTGDGENPVRWYLKFIREYLPGWTLCFFLAKWLLIFLVLNAIAQISLFNFLFFWVLPLLLSSIQLFWFGTYLPHRRNSSEPSDYHYSRSNQYPIVISFITCYYLGYHWEHHEYPYLPWYKLPNARFRHGQFQA
jgi:beta-carotene ketolase (CrtW type)